MNDRKETLIKYAEESEKTVDLFLKIAVWFLILITIWFACLIIYVTPVEAGVTNANHQFNVCESDKCRARVARIQECDDLHSKKENILDCATKTTLTASYEGIYTQLDSLYLLMNTEPLEETVWKTKTLTLLKKHEEFSTEAYCDRLIPFTRSDWTPWLKRDCPTGNERYSIGYWTISYKWEPNITKAEATRRMLEEVENNFYPYIENVNCWNDNQKAAIADFMYNSWVWVEHAQTEIPFQYYVKTCNYNEVLWFMDYWLYAGWSIVRKKAERDLFLSED